MAEPKLMLDYIYENAAKHPQRVFLTQPVGGSKVVDYTWGEVLDQAQLAIPKADLGERRQDEIGDLTEGQGYIIKLNAAHSGFILP